MLIEALKVTGQVVAVAVGGAVVAAGVAAGVVVGKHLGETANALGDALVLHLLTSPSEPAPAPSHNGMRQHQAAATP
jgi:hypothetical protein